MNGRSLARRAATGTVLLAAVAATAPTLAPAASASTTTGSLPGVVSAFDAAWGDVDARQVAASLDATGRWVPGRDAGSLRSIVSGLRARLLGSTQPTGKGVTVAVVDTGIAPVRGLDGVGKVVNGPDLSFEGQRASTRHVDGYGHGTHLAGIIAGQDLKSDGRTPDPDGFAGVAPDAQLLNMKVGAADGAADVSQVIAAIDWVVARRRDNGMNVRVLSLAYGTSSLQSWQVDPLAKAVENAWDAGIVVVAAAGNDGLAAPLLMPALDPRIIAVGAVDEKGTSTRADDVVADFSNGGTATRRPDLLTPGRSIVSLRVPGSYVDTYHPEGRVVGDTSGRFFRGSGTSQATAVLAGEAALLLQARPMLTPDQVKRVLRSTADPLPQPRPEMGAGVADVAEATQVLPPLGVGSSASATGTGSLEAARGGEHVLDPVNGVVLTGEVDALGSPWKASTWASASTKRTSWQGGAWNGRTWAGTAWSGTTWAPGTWTGTSWSGVAWLSRTWSSATWSAGAWTGNDWQGRSWREASWLGRSWRDNAWVGRSWRSLP